MIVNVYVIVDPKGDRPYVSTTLPASLDRKGGEVKVWHFALAVPDATPVDTLICTQAPIEIPLPPPKETP